MPSPPRKTPLMVGLVFTKSDAFQQMLASMKYWASRWTAFHQPTQEGRAHQDQVAHLPRDGEDQDGVEDHRQVSADPLRPGIRSAGEAAAAAAGHLMSLEGPSSPVLSENRRMELQGDILNLQRDKHLRAARLQWCLQELREREGKARRHNQQLLQDFHRAQESLGEMVACTATMNTIRLEYERYLQENSPRWHQQLRESARASQKKRMDESLKRREEEQVSASSTGEPFFAPPGGNSLYRTARTTPTRNYDCALQNTPRPQRAWSAPEDPCRARSIVSPTMPSSSRPSQAHRSHDALRFHSPTVVPQPGPSQVHRRTSPQQGPPTWGAPWSHWSPAWASNAVGSPPGLSTPWAPPPSTAGPSARGLAPGRGAVGVMAPDAEGWGENRKSGSKCSSQELDIKPVRLSGAHGDSSDSGSGRGHRGRRKRREEGGQRSDSDRKSSSQESAGTSSADSEVKQTTSAARGRRVTEGQVSGAPSETESNSASGRGGGKSVQERRAEGRTGVDPDHSGSHRETGRKTQKSKSEVEESSGHMTDDDDEDPSDQSEGSRKERGHQKEDSVSVGTKSERGPAAAAERVGEEAGEVQEDPGETDGDTSSENEDNEKDEGESRREENKEEEDEGGEDGETEGQEQPGSSESESAASRSQAEEDQETNGFQTEIEDEEEEEVEEEEEEEEDDEEEVDEGDGGAGIEKPGQGSQAGESEEESDSDDGIVSPQEHRSIKKVQSISKEEEDEADGDEEGEEGEGSGGEHSDDDEVDDIERLVAPETHRKQENKPKSPDKTKVIKKDSFEESLPVESNKEVKMAEDTDDEFDHFYD
ncbi:Midasin [Merluccius polli]|uniref:Midasin n=1 Tax=Merluccius polli TaxID=89951 RepID=A0AA47MEB6_MERPO|nr:Midasin [Merluccius polli]